MRPTRTGLLAAWAECVTCGWTAASRNALGLAAQHHDRTGHKVQIEQTIGITYGDLSDTPGEPPPDIEGQEELV